MVKINFFFSPIHQSRDYGYQWGEARGATQRWGIKRFEQLSIKQTTKIYHATWGSYFL